VHLHYLVLFQGIDSYIIDPKECLLHIAKNKILLDISFKEVIFQLVFLLESKHAILNLSYDSDIFNSR
jgi:hypothetical protein